MSTKKKGIRLENHVFELCAGNLERKLPSAESRLRVAERLVQLCKEQVEDEENEDALLLGEQTEEQSALPL